MSTFRQDLLNNLIAAAKLRFDPVLQPGEMKVLEDSVTGDAPQVLNGSRQVVRPEFLRWLATDEEIQNYIDPQGIRVFSATIPGILDLSFCTIASLLHFRDCSFDDLVVLLHAELRGLCIYSSISKGILAHGAKIHGPVFLLDGFQSFGPIELHSAVLDQALDCRGAILKSSELPLILDHASIKGGVNLGQGFSSAGEIHMVSVKIEGDLDCRDASFTGSLVGNALSADRAKISGNVVFSQSVIRGIVSLLGADIGGQFNCVKAQLVTPNSALALDLSTVRGGVDLTGVKSAAELSLIAASVIGSLNCSDAILTAQTRTLSMDRASVQGTVFLRNIQSAGAIMMSNSTISTNLDCRGASITTLHCANMKLGGDLTWTGIRNAPQATLNLTAASLRNLQEDKASWPKAGNLVLDRLVYEELSLYPCASPDQLAINNLSWNIPMNVEDRVSWLNRQPASQRSEPQPWLQLSRLLETKGDKRSAKRVIYLLRRQQAIERGSARAAVSIPFAWLEENPFRILYSLALILFFGTILFSFASLHGLIAPTDKDAYTAWAGGQPYLAAYPRFQPFVYTLENALPLVKLGQDDKWAPNPNGPSHCNFLEYRVLVIFRWLLILLGWFQATLLAAAVGSRFKP